MNMNYIARALARASLLVAAMLGIAQPALSQETPRRGGAIVLALGADAAVINPSISIGVPDLLTGCIVYEGLIRFGKGFQIVPALAKSWTISDDQLTYRFQLEDAKWHDGKPVTSSDVKFSLLEVSSKLGPKFIAPGKFIDSIDTPDPKAVVIKLKQPFGPFLFSLACEQNAAILPEHVFRDKDVTAVSANETPIGSGPFKLTERVRGDRLVFSRNADYWRKGEPYLDRIIIKLMPDTSARVLALRSGQIDLIDYYYFPLSAFATFKGDNRFQFREVSYPNNEVMIINTKNTPFDRPKVRQALLTALDRNFIVKTIFYDLGQPAQSAIDTRLWAHDPTVSYDKTYPFNPDRAKKLLDEAGLPVGADGTRFALRLVYDPGRPEYTPLAQALQRFWGAVGIKVAMEPSERAVMLKRVFTDYDYDVTLQNYTTSGDPALGIARLYVTDSIKSGQTFNNASRYSNPEVDAYFAQGRDGTSREARIEAYKKVQHILLEELPTIPYYQQAQMEASTSKLRGLDKGMYTWWGSIWLAR
jgi:peptide/nickel transport system substrate-binding protein